MSYSSLFLSPCYKSVWNSLFIYYFLSFLSQQIISNFGSVHKSRGGELAKIFVAEAVGTLRELFRAAWMLVWPGQHTLLVPFQPLFLLHLVANLLLLSEVVGVQIWWPLTILRNAQTLLLSQTYPCLPGRTVYCTYVHMTFAAFSTHFDS